MSRNVAEFQRESLAVRHESAAPRIERIANAMGVGVPQGSLRLEPPANIWPPRPRAVVEANANSGIGARDGSNCEPGATILSCGREAFYINDDRLAQASQTG